LCTGGTLFSHAVGLDILLSGSLLLVGRRKIQNFLGFSQTFLSVDFVAVLGLSIVLLEDEICGMRRTEVSLIATGDET
jgi:hypothetical protein